MAGTTYLITGANRGIGLGLTTALLKRPDTTVIAAVRNPSSATSLSQVPAASGSKVIVVKIDSQALEDPANAIAELQSKHGITKLDTVIANAGISSIYEPAATTPIAETQQHVEVNFIGPLVLFQAVLPLLEKGTNPKFVGISTGIASIADMAKWAPIPVTAYGASKAALNYFLRKAHFENEKLTIYALSPGMVQTEMGNFGAKKFGMEAAPVTMEESVKGILANVDSATRAETGGTFQSFDEEKYAW